MNIPSLRSLLKIFSPLFILIILFLLIGRVAYPRIAAQRESLEEAEKINNVLQSKLSLLQEIQTEAPLLSNRVSVALPQDNSSLLALSQIKNEAARRLLVINEARVGGQIPKDGLVGSQLSFELTGDFFQVLDFLNSVDNLAPIIRVENVKISQSGGQGIAAVSLSTYWSSFPEKLPAITDPITEFTNDERNLLTELSNLIQPFFTEVPPQGPGFRPDPFSL